MAKLKYFTSWLIAVIVTTYLVHDRRVFAQTQHVDTCYNVGKTITCPAGATLNIDKAVYGRHHTSPATCGWPSGGTLAPIGCVNTIRATDAMNRRCRGKNSCWYHTCPPLFAITRCYVTYGRNRYDGYLHLEYTCSRDCSWQSWSGWSTCTKTCGRGMSTRQRGKIGHLGRGTPCSGNYQESMYCNQQACATDCRWNVWSSWSSCSATCGVGLKSRNRTKVPATGGGRACTGNDIQRMTCQKVVCSTPCRWNDWGTWSSCSKTCGLGIKNRQRTNVEATGGGAACVGSASQTFTCRDQECLSCWKLWGGWGPCSRTCGMGSQRRTRLFNTEVGPGVPCEGDSVEVRSCTLMMTCGGGGGDDHQV